MGYISRVWHDFQTHPNFHGEMTHNLFIKHYHIDKKNVSSLGNIYFNLNTKEWELEPNKPFISIKHDRFHQDRQLILNFMNTAYKTDVQMINFSLKEQQLSSVYQRIKNLCFVQNINSN